MFSIESGMKASNEKLQLQSQHYRNHISSIQRRKMMMEFVRDAFVPRTFQNVSRKHNDGDCDYNAIISISGRPLCNLHFAYDIELIALNRYITPRPDYKTKAFSRSYGVEISVEESRILVNNLA